MSVYRAVAKVLHTSKNYFDVESVDMGTDVGASVRVVMWLCGKRGLAVTSKTQIQSRPLSLGVGIKETHNHSRAYLYSICEIHRKI
jgi:hypothetical protein